MWNPAPPGGDERAQAVAGPTVETIELLAGDFARNDPVEVTLFCAVVVLAAEHAKQPDRMGGEGADFPPWYDVLFIRVADGAAENAGLVSRQRALERSQVDAGAAESGAGRVKQRARQVRWVRRPRELLR